MRKINAVRAPVWALGVASLFSGGCWQVQVSEDGVHVGSFFGVGTVDLSNGDSPPPPPPCDDCPDPDPCDDCPPDPDPCDNCPPDPDPCDDCPPPCIPGASGCDGKGAVWLNLVDAQGSSALIAVMGDSDENDVEEVVLAYDIFNTTTHSWTPIWEQEAVVHQTVSINLGAFGDWCVTAFSPDGTTVRSECKCFSTPANGELPTAEDSRPSYCPN